MSAGIIIPLFIVLLLVYALIKRVDVYGAFVEGAREAFPLLLKILPYIAAMLISIRIMRVSGFTDLLVSLFSPLFRLLGVPAELTPLMVLRPFSGSGALALLSDVYAEYGADTFIGLSASVVLGSTETIFYTIPLYFGSVNILKMRYALPAGIIITILGELIAVYISYIFWG